MDDIINFLTKSVKVDIYMNYLNGSKENVSTQFHIIQYTMYEYNLQMYLNATENGLKM